MRFIAVYTSAVLFAVSAFCAGTSPQVTLTRKPNSVILANGIVSVEIDKTNGDPVVLN